MSAWRLECEDVSNWAKSYKGEKFHALLCDSPYEYGFMGKSWDDSGVSYRAEVWAALAEHLHPGAFGMAFGGARSWHRLACAIEDAGLRIHPSIFGWAYGCLSDDTEILTSEGWKSYRDNLTGSMVMCYNLKDGTFDYMPVQEVFEYEISDTAFRIQSDSTDQIVTKDHRCLVERSGKFVFKRASALERKEKIPVLEGVPDVWSSVYGDELRRVPQKESLFAEMRHGNITTQTQKEPTWTAQRQIGIFSKAQAQREDYHLSSVWQEGVQAACFSQGCQGADMLQAVQWDTPGPRMGQTWRQGSRRLDRCEHGILSKENVWPEQPGMERRRDLLPQKRQLRRLQNQICALSREILADGSQGRLCDGTSSDCGAAFRPLSQAVGGCASQGPQSREQPSFQSDVIQEQQRTQEIRGDWQPRPSLATVTPFHYKGIVWCVRVPTGAFVARRNGHIFITGNSGFPKATRIDTQIDKAAGAEREEYRRTDGRYAYGFSDSTKWHGQDGFGNGDRKNVIGVPATPLAAEWEGHRYGLQCMKPACEPLVTFSKPLTCEPIYSTISTTTFLVEVLLCMFSNVQDAESLTNQIHQRLRAVVDNSVPGNADVWALLESVIIAGDPSVSSLARSTVRDFVAGPALTKDVTRQLVPTILAGAVGGLSVRDTSMSDTMADILRSIGWLWSSILADILNRGNTYITETAIHWITDLRILESYLSRTIQESTIQGEQDGSRLLALTVESLLRSLLAKLPLLNGTTATENATVPPVEKGIDQEEGRPSLEPIIVFQKPYDGKSVDCIVETGAGALNIDDSRIGGAVPPTGSGPSHIYGWANTEKDPKWAGSSGRWPANFILQHSPECVRVGEKRVKGDGAFPKKVKARNPIRFRSDEERPQRIEMAGADGLETVAEWRCVPECPVRRLGEQSGELQSGKLSPENNVKPSSGWSGGSYANRVKSNFEPNKGTAARFFYQSDWSLDIAEQLANADAVYYTAKAAKREREAGLFGVIPCAEETCRGLTTTTHINKNGKEVPCRRCIHPTVKPISLTKYLATILLPPPAYAPRRIIVPFAGIASEMIGAALVGWEEIVGIELEQIYCNIGEARLNHWTKTPTQLNLL